MKYRVPLIVGLCLVSICINALAQDRTMQLLAPSRGWALANGALFWTDDNGEHWNDITPKPAEGSITSVFFLDMSRAWVLFVADAGNDMLRLNLATTTTRGHTWSFKAVPIPKQSPGELVPGAQWVNFADNVHGWIVLKKYTSSAFSIARLLATQDGGENWNELPQTNLAKPVLFVTPTNGWMVGNSAGGSGFLQSHDGGKTWQDVNAHDTSSVENVVSYGSLRFSDAKHGSIPVIFSPVADSTEGSKLVLFTTVDGGTTWIAERKVPIRDESVLSTFADSTVIVLRGPTLTAVAPDGTANKKQIGGIDATTHFNEASFVNSTIGWLRTNDGRLLSTVNGGGTVTWLVPGSAPRKLPPVTLKPPSAKLRSQPLPLPSAMNFRPTAASSLHYSEHLGFDQHSAFTEAQMSVWWTTSPFSDVGFYVGGANYCYKYDSTTQTCTTRLDPRITAQWVTDKTTEGWGLIPIWVGLQAPCNTTNVSKFDSTPAAARAQGQSDATNAASAMAGLGLSGTLIFFDMENYTAAAGSACSLAVRAFLTGWVQTMNANGFSTTAVYGNPGPAERDFSQVSNLSEVWITQVVQNGNNSPRVTIWGLGSGSNALEDILWNGNQRGHQFLIDAPNINYGGVMAAVDFDVENFQVPGGSVAKPYSWAASPAVNVQAAFPANYGGATPTAINNVISDSLGIHFLTGGELGQSIGWFYTYPSSGVCTYACPTSYIDNGGALTSFQDPNSLLSTNGLGLNDATQAVGTYCYFSYEGQTLCFVYAQGQGYTAPAARNS